MYSTATRSSKTSSSNSKAAMESKSNVSGHGKSAARSNVSTKPGKSGTLKRPAKQPKSGARASQRVITPALRKEIQHLRVLGIAMTGIHKFVQQKNPELRYYDVWKVLREA